MVCTRLGDGSGEGSLVEILPKRFSSSAVRAHIPYVWVEVTGNVTTGNVQGQRSDSMDGIGDILLFPTIEGNLPAIAGNQPSAEVAVIL